MAYQQPPKYAMACSPMANGSPDCPSVEPIANAPAEHARSSAACAASVETDLSERLTSSSRSSFSFLAPSSAQVLIHCVVGMEAGQGVFEAGRGVVVVVGVRPSPPSPPSTKKPPSLSHPQRRARLLRRHARRLERLELLRDHVLEPFVIRLKGGGRMRGQGEVG